MGFEPGAVSGAFLLAPRTPHFAQGRGLARLRSDLFRFDLDLLFIINLEGQNFVFVPISWRFRVNLSENFYICLNHL